MPHNTTSNGYTANRATVIDCDPISNAIVRSIQPVIDELVARVATLESEQHGARHASVTTFANSRTSWTVKQLAEDLDVHVNTIRNWVALPENHRMRLECLRLDQQIRFLPEHIAEWLSRNECRAPLDKEWRAS